MQLHVPCPIFCREGKRSNTMSSRCPFAGATTGGGVCPVKAADKSRAGLCPAAKSDKSITGVCPVTARVMVVSTRKVPMAVKKRAPMILAWCRQSARLATTPTRSSWVRSAALSARRCSMKAANASRVPINSASVSHASHPAEVHFMFHSLLQ